MPHPFGRWLSTFCAFIMLLGLVTGIITHKKIFKEFFTFRPGKGQRSWLDGHNAIGVLVLPFHLMISYSSLVLFMYMVMPAGIMASYGNDTGKYFNDLFGRDDSFKAAQVATPLVALPTLYPKVQELQPGARIGFIQAEPRRQQCPRYLHPVGCRPRGLSAQCQLDVRRRQWCAAEPGQARERGDDDCLQFCRAAHGQFRRALAALAVFLLWRRRHCGDRHRAGDVAG